MREAWSPWRPGRRDQVVGYLVDAVLALASKELREHANRGFILALRERQTEPRLPVAPLADWLLEHEAPRWGVRYPDGTEDWGSDWTMGSVRDHVRKHRTTVGVYGFPDEPVHPGQESIPVPASDPEPFPRLYQRTFPPEPAAARPCGCRCHWDPAFKHMRACCPAFAP